MKLVNLPKSFLDNVGGVKGIGALIEDCGFDSDRIFFSYVKRSNKKVGVIFSILKGDEISTGVSKCHTEDTFSKAEGFRIAILNALESNTNYPQSFGRDVDKHMKRVKRYFFGPKEDNIVKEIEDVSDFAGLFADILKDTSKSKKDECGCSGKKDGSGKCRCGENKPSLLDEMKKIISDNSFTKSIFNGKSIFSDVKDDEAETFNTQEKAIDLLTKLLNIGPKEEAVEDEIIEDVLSFSEEDENLLNIIADYAESVGMEISKLTDDMYIAQGCSSAFVGIVHSKKDNTINVLYDANEVEKICSTNNVDFDALVDMMNESPCGARFL